MSVVVRVALLRPMARLDPAGWGPRLAGALITRSQVVSGLRGGTARRTAAAEEAVALCRRLVAERPDRHRTALARALVARAGVPDVRPTTAVIAELTEAIGYVEESSDRLGLVALATARMLLARHRAISARYGRRSRRRGWRCAPGPARNRSPSTTGPGGSSPCWWSGNARRRWSGPTKRSTSAGRPGTRTAAFPGGTGCAGCPSAPTRR